MLHHSIWYSTMLYKCNVCLIFNLAMFDDTKVHQRVPCRMLSYDMVAHHRKLISYEVVCVWNILHQMIPHNLVLWILYHMTPHDLVRNYIIAHEFAWYYLMLLDIAWYCMISNEILYVIIILLLHDSISYHTESYHVI